MRVVLMLSMIAAAACGRLRFDEVDEVVERCEFRSITTGRAFTCGIDSLGRVWCWGVNDEGQIAIAGSRVILDATPIALPAAAVQIDAGRAFTCARLESGAVWCWGANQLGELGSGTNAPRSSPVEVPLGAERAIDLGAGGHHACIRRQSDSAVMCWGDNTHFALGNTTMAKQPPTLVAGTAGATQLVIGHRHNCIVDAAQTALCWGRDDGGHLGDGMASAARETPAPVVGLGPVQRIVPGGGFTCAIEVDGDVRCWGRNEVGQLADPSYFQSAMPGPTIITDAREVAVGTEGACATRGDGTVMCWGSMSGGGTGASIASPRVADVSGVTQLRASFYHSCAFGPDGPLCWGNNADGALGRGARSVVAEPIPLTLPAAPTQIAGDGVAICALAGDAVYCWGQNPYGQLGDAAIGGASVREVSTGITGIVGIDAGVRHFCVWNATTVRCWGANTQGQLGNGMIVHNSPPVTASIGSVAAIDAGATHTCARLSGSIQCWGQNNDGQLSGPSASSLVPIAVANITAPTALSSAVNHNCAIDAGAVRCWGWNLFGQLGDNTNMNRRQPVTPAIPGTATDVSVAKQHSCALTSTGEVYCWGSNVVGQLGVGDRTERLVPTAVALPAAATRIEAGGASTCAILATTAVYCWGSGHHGGLANGMFEDSLVPVEVPALAGATQLVQADLGGCMLRAGSVSCWGAAHPEVLVDEGTPKPVTLSCGP